MVDEIGSQEASSDEMLYGMQRDNGEKESKEQNGMIKSLLNGVWADELAEGQNLAVGGSFIDSDYQVKLKLDFNAFNERMENLSPDALRTKFEQDRESVEAWLESAGQTTGRKVDINPYLFYCLQQIQATTLALLNYDPKNQPPSLKRREIYNKQNPKLSELIGNSHCAEIAILGQYALQKAGIDSAYVGGISMFDPNNQDEYAEAHSFLVIKGDEGHGKYIFDIARPGQHNLPTILKPSVAFDYDLIKGKGEKLVGAEEILLGEKRYFGVGEQVAGKHKVIS